jgi:hypothetical protein
MSILRLYVIVLSVSSKLILLIILEELKDILLSINIKL